MQQNIQGVMEHCDRLNQNIHDISTLYLASEAGAKLLERLEIPEGFDLEMHMSDNFHVSATTIRTPAEVLALYGSGEYARLNAYQTVVSLCSVFEVWSESVLNLVGAQKKKKPLVVVSSRRQNQSVTIRTGALCNVSAIHEACDVESQLITNSALCWIYNFFVLRNAIVHESGLITTQVRQRLVGKWRKQSVGERISLEGNDIDDMVHFLQLNVGAFRYKFLERWDG
jgi:hypothetical protein